jgi:hypothetical protein
MNNEQKIIEAKQIIADRLLIKRAVRLGKLTKEQEQAAKFGLMKRMEDLLK